MAETPLMTQYFSVKAKYPDAILLFRVGDFYETYCEDAIKASEVLGIALTSHSKGANKERIELAGFPYHALDNYLPRLVRAGLRVAICEQLEDPRLTKKLVKRGVTELVTPGIASIYDNTTTSKENNFLAAVHLAGGVAGVAFLDISTGEFLLAEGSFEYVEQLINNLQPKEVLFNGAERKSFFSLFGDKLCTYKLDEWVFTFEAGHDRLLKQFATTSLKGFGIDTFAKGIIAAGAILYYLDLTKHEQLGHINHIARIERDEYLWIDKFTIRNLELFYSPYEGAKTFCEVIDKTETAMGSRLLKRWISLPLKSKEDIDSRLDIVDCFCSYPHLDEVVSTALGKIGDLERLISKVAVNRVSPRDIVQLKRALDAIEPLKSVCLQANCVALSNLANRLDSCSLLAKKIGESINENPPYLVSKGNIIAKGFSDELDTLRDIVYNGKQYINNIQQNEIKRTGITSLKVGFNNIFGYYLEVTNSQRDKVPSEWIRRQTLVGGERYITPELKEYEEKIVGAEEKITALEGQLFEQVVNSILEYMTPIQTNCVVVSQIDVLRSFAQCATEYNYHRPTITNELSIDIKEGRHPVIERQMKSGESYVPNDIYLDREEQQIIILTGPNMSGKSALLRQTALIVLMAQIGSFVPAEAAKIGVVDKIFTRVGASDNISLGESTFMVEMNETASILNNLSERSLVLLDEIGRGTSTYDGISIAWAIVEYLHENQSRAKTIFATHYHELNEMESSFKRISNFNVSIVENKNKIIFLRKLKRGGSEHSFGIHVAKIAGMPRSVVRRAEAILKEMEDGSGKNGGKAKPLDNIAEHREGLQLSLFQLDDPILKQIRNELIGLDIDNLTPIEALNKLYNIKKIL